MKDRKPRRHFSAEQKATAVKRHLLEGDVSAICNELDLLFTQAAYYAEIPKKSVLPAF